MKNMKSMKKSGGFNAVIPDPDPESRSSRKKRMMESLTYKKDPVFDVSFQLDALSLALFS